MNELVDQYGRPLKSSAIYAEEAVPRLASVRTIHHNYSSAGLEPQQWASYMRQADEGDPLAYLEIAEQIEEKDPHYAGVLGQRKRGVTSLDITVEAAGDDAVAEEHAQLIRDWLDRDELSDELENIMDAVGKGYSVCEMIWNRGTQLPERIEWRDPRWFKFDRVDGPRLKLRSDGGELRDLARYKYIVHQVRSKSGLPIRGGVVRPVSWYWLYKNFAVRDWVVFAEVYGQPIRVGKYGPGSTEADRRVLMRAVANLGSDAGAIIPDSMMIEFVKDANPTGTADLFERLCKYCDEQISKAVLGQTTTTDSIAGGGLAGNASHNDVRGDIIDADARGLAATLNRDLVRSIIDVHFGPQAKYPRIRIRRPEAVDVTTVSAAMTAFVGVGGKVDAKRMGDMLGLPVAEDGDDVLSPPAAAPAYPAMMSTRASEQKATAAQARPTDAIDAAADELAGDWEEILNPTVGLIEAALNESSSFEEFGNKMLELAAQNGDPKMVEAMEKALASSRLAGNLNVKLS